MDRAGQGRADVLAGFAPAEEYAAAFLAERALSWHLAWDWSQQHLVALTAEGGADALATVEVSGPLWLAGDPRFIEGGALVIAIELVAGGALLAWAYRSGRAPRWGQRLW